MRIRGRIAAGMRGDLRRLGVPSRLLTARGPRRTASDGASSGNTP